MGAVCKEEESFSRVVPLVWLLLKSFSVEVILYPDQAIASSLQGFTVISHPKGDTVALVTFGVKAQLFGLGSC